MHIQAIKIKNYRRLKNVKVELDKDISIFVGANNSGKTSAAHALQFFTSAVRDKVSIHDFSSECWDQINGFGRADADVSLPKMSLDIWFHAEANDLHRVIDLLPSLAWAGTSVGIRIEFIAIDESKLMQRFLEAYRTAQANIRPAQNGTSEFHPKPCNLYEYLSENLKREFEFRYYVLDHSQFDVELNEIAGYEPQLLVSDTSKSGKEILNSILRVDFLNAQRHLSDNTGGNRSEDLSKCLSRFYERNLEKRGDDYDAMQALAESEKLLNEHLSRVFEPTLDRLSDLGYPGLTNPKLLIKSALNPATIMNNHDGAKVHYVVNDLGNSENTLPDKYNGLGFKNLIYMVVELLDLHAQWLDIDENRPPLHLIFIEEPEAHLHAQLQQVFIKKVIDILAIAGAEAALYHSQLVISTHSPHIVYERGFRPIRYFRRQKNLNGQSSEVLNLSKFYADSTNPTRDFLERYLKLTHCDLFFADAAILVEGNVERLLLPIMIDKSAPRLNSVYLSILEIGGAFGHKFRSLIEFLGLTTLIITDIDSIAPIPDGEEEDDDDLQEVENQPGKACMANVVGAITSNQTLIQWLPQKTIISELLAATVEDKTQTLAHEDRDLVYVTYQNSLEVSWRAATNQMVGRTLEEAFALENLTWCQNPDNHELKLLIKRNSELTLQELATKIHKRVKGASFNKTDFALALLEKDPISWITPQYILSGLEWLENETTPAIVAINPLGEAQIQ